MSKPRVIDVFPFLDEEGPLLARYLELESVVDLFVGVEANLTHNGSKNAPRLRETLIKLGIHEDRFHIIEADISAGKTSFERDALHKNAAKDFIINNLTSHDYVVFGDVDEVPRLEAVHDAIKRLESGSSHCVFAQEMCFGYFNYREETGRLLSFMGEFPGTRRKNRRWLGTVMQKVGTLRSVELSGLRHPETKIRAFRVQDGGWHFSTCGGSIEDGLERRVWNKFSASAHEEFSWLTELSAAEIETTIARGEDLLRRRFVRFKTQDPVAFLSDRITCDTRLQKLYFNPPK